jgi:hypothetical protein
MGFLADWAGGSVREKGVACNFLVVNSEYNFTRVQEGNLVRKGLGKQKGPALEHREGDNLI